MTFSLQRIHVLGIGLVCLAVAGIALVGPVSGPAGASTTEAEDHFAVLGKSPTAGDSAFFASPIAQQLASMNADTTPDPQAARSRVAGIVGLADTTREISVTSGTNGRVCLGHKGTSVGSPILINCAPLAAATTQGLVSISHPAPGLGVDPGSTDVTALVPDGVDSVRFLLSTGDRSSATVTDNTVTAHLKAPVSMSFDAGTGPQVINFGGQ